MIINAQKIKQYEIKVNFLKQELLSLVEQWQDLRDDVHPRLMYAYETLFGSLEYELKKRKQLSVENSRKLEMLNLQISKGEVIDLNKLKYFHNQIRSNQKTSKLKSNSSKIDSFFNSYDKTKETTLIPISVVDEKYEMVQIYRDLVKRIHPDLNGDNYNFRRYWHSIQSSYKNANIQRLRLYHQTLCPIEYTNFKEKNVIYNSLKNQESELKNSIKKEKQKIQEILEKEPFNLEKKFYNEKWINNRRKHLKAKIFNTDMRIKIQDRKFQSLIQSNSYAVMA